MKKLMKKFGCFILLLLVLAAAVVLLKPGEVVPDYVFSYAENQEEDYPTTLAGKYFAQLVEERTHGRIRILVQHGGKRGDESQVVEQLKYGGVDFARVSLSELTDEIPKLNVLQMPYLYRDSEHMWKVLDGEIGQHFLDVISETQLVGLSWYDGGARNFYTVNQSIRTLEDLSGMKIRVQDSNLMADMVEALGAEPVRQAYSEVYSMLERHEVDGAENNWPSYESTQHYEVAGYITMDEHTRVPEIQLCSKHTWEKLSKEDQEIIAECARESAIYQRELWVAQEKKSKDRAIAGGTKVITISAGEKRKFQQAVQPLYEKYCKESMDLIEKIIAQSGGFC